MTAERARPGGGSIPRRYLPVATYRNSLPAGAVHPMRDRDVNDDRHQGVEFGELQTDLADAEYPIAHAELLDRFGEREIVHVGGSASLRSLLAPMQGGETYDSAGEVIDTVLTMIGDEAEGRKDYTDRESNATGPDYEPQSF